MATMSQSGSQASITSVLNQVEQLIPRLAAGPYSDSTLANLSTICTELKTFGPELDKKHKEKMDIMQTLLTRICQDTQLNLELRLQVLEVIELRTLNWVSNETVDKYYQERFAQFEEKRRKERERKENKATKNKVDKKRKLSQTTPSMSSILEDKKSAIMDCVIDNSSTGTGSRKALVSQLRSQSSIQDSHDVGVKYSRTELLSLATSPLCREAPHHWDKLLPKLPSVIVQKSPRTSNPVVGNEKAISKLAETKTAQKNSGL